MGMWRCRSEIVVSFDGLAGLPAIEEYASMATTRMTVAWEVADLSAEAKIVRTVLGGTIDWMSPRHPSAHHAGADCRNERGRDLILKALEELVSKDWALEDITDGARRWTGCRRGGVLMISRARDRNSSEYNIFQLECAWRLRSFQRNYEDGSSTIATSISIPASRRSWISELCFLVS